MSDLLSKIQIILRRDMRLLRCLRIQRYEIRTRIPASHMILFEVVLEGRNKLDAVDHVRLILRELFVVLPLFCVIVEPLSMAAHQCRLLCLMGFVELQYTNPTVCLL